MRWIACPACQTLNNPAGLHPDQAIICVGCSRRIDPKPDRPEMPRLRALTVFLCYAGAVSSAIVCGMVVFALVTHTSSGTASLPRKLTASGIVSEHPLFPRQNSDPMPAKPIRVKLVDGVYQGPVRFRGAPGPGANGSQDYEFEGEEWARYRVTMVGTQFAVISVIGPRGFVEVTVETLAATKEFTFRPSKTGTYKVSIQTRDFRATELTIRKLPADANFP